MSKRTKVILGVLSGVLVFMLGLLFLVNVVYEPEPEKLVYPQGELSDSIFVGQNNNYEPNDALTITHSFETVPYAVDVPEAQGATIGSGKVYQLSDELFVYVTEFDDTTQVEDMAKYDRTVQMQDILASQFPQALLINYIPEETHVTAEINDKGFINGFTAQYLADSVGITDGKQLVNSAVLGYVLDVEEKGFEGKHMFVSVGTNNLTNQSLQDCATILSAVIKTVRLDDELYKAMTKDMNLEEEEVAENTEEMAEGEMAEDDMARGNNEEDVYERTLTQYTEGAQVQVDVNWEMDNPDAILELFLPGGDRYAEPLNQSGTSAQFVLTNAPAGDYVLRIKNYEGCGDIYDNLNDTEGDYATGSSSDSASWYDTNSDGPSSDSSSSSEGISYISDDSASASSSDSSTY